MVIYQNQNKSMQVIGYRTLLFSLSACFIVCVRVRMRVCMCVCVGAHVIWKKYIS